MKNKGEKDVSMVSSAFQFAICISQFSIAFLLVGVSVVRLSKRKTDSPATRTASRCEWPGWLFQSRNQVVCQGRLVRSPA